MPIKPRGSVERRESGKAEFLRFFDIEKFDIAEWCPDDEGEVPPEQVHLIVYLKGLDDSPLVMRFKGPDTIGFFIEELAKYRRSVWPDSEKVQGEK